jgi:hypothetical protein
MIALEAQTMPPVAFCVLAPIGWLRIRIEMVKKPRADGQISGLAGEFFVAAELLKRDMQTSVTFGNAKAIDLLAVHPKTGRQFAVQVKTLRTMNYFLIAQDRVKRAHVYVFVLLNKPGQSVQYFVVPGAVLLDDAGRFGKPVQDPKMPGIHPRDLAPFRDNWSCFDQAENAMQVE